MKLRIIIALISLLITMSCLNKNNSSQCHIYQTNIDGEDRDFKYLLTDKDEQYLIGSFISDFRDSRTYKVVIKRVRKGKEKTWISLKVDIIGQCQAVTQTENYIYLISEQYSRKNFNPKYSKQKLYKISKENGKIEELYNWSKKNSLVKNLYFTSDKKGIVFFRPSGNPLDYQIFSTVDGGKEWTFKKLNRPVVKTHFAQDRFFFLSYKRNNGNHWLYEMDNEFSLDSTRFKMDVTDFKVEEDGSYWLLGKEENKTVLQHYKNGKTTEIKTFSNDPDFFPTQLYKYKDLIVVLAAQIEESLLGGLGGTKPAMFLSKDNGLTWTKQSLGKVLYLKPVSFEKDKVMTAYVGNGKILTCRFIK